MFDPVRELKIRAQILHRSVQAGEREAISRLRALSELRRADGGELEAAAARVQRKHCLAVVAHEQGFRGWEHALRVLEGDGREADLGTLLYGASCRAHLTTWFASHDEAREVLEALAERGERGYLLGYRRQFFVADEHFVASLGLDPGDVDWAAIGWDWPRPRDREARRRLYGKLLGGQRSQAA